MNRTSNVRKQNSSGHFSPKSPDCLPDGSGSLIRIEQKLVWSVSRSLITECTLTDQETFGMKSQKRRRLWPTPGCNAMKEEELLSTLMHMSHPGTSWNNMLEIRLFHLLPFTYSHFHFLIIVDLATRMQWINLELWVITFTTLFPRSRCIHIHPWCAGSTTVTSVTVLIIEAQLQL
jgi:hypothetical protein